LTDYSGYYALNEILSKEPTYIRARKLFNVDGKQLFREVMDRLAMPLADGTPSPFSSRNPLSAEGILMEQVVFLLLLIGYELNLVPDYILIQWLRLWGFEMLQADYPRLEITFYRQSPGNYASYGYYETDLAIIPLGTKIVSSRDSDLWVITTEFAEMLPSETSKVVPARLNRKGKIAPEVSAGEFSYLPNLINFIQGVKGTAITYPGRDAETLPQTVLRARQEMQMPLGMVTDRHYYLVAKELGAEKVLILPGLEYDNPGYDADMVTVVVWPGGIADYIEVQMISRKLSGTRVGVYPADIIELTGTIDVEIVPSVTNSEALSKAASIIQSSINPPYGLWGDRTFNSTLASTLVKNSPEIYGIPGMNLYRVDTGESLATVESSINPWSLFQLADSVTFNWLR
jgi:hypothetical protein